jgi:hypothetical protein
MLSCCTQATLTSSASHTASWLQAAAAAEAQQQQQQQQQQ